MSSGLFDELHEVMRATSELLTREIDTSAESLAARTRQLARVYEDESNADTLHVLTCRIGNEKYGWPAANVRAIARIGKLTPVPSAPPFYRGVTSSRGQVLSVMDLGVYFGLPPADPLPELLIVVGGQLEIGVLADDVFDVANIQPSELTGAGLDPELVRGITTDGLSILDADGLLAREWRRIHEDGR